MRILSLGAGVQSTTLYLTELWDYAIFADTQEEPTPVSAHLEWLKSLGKAPIIVRTAGKLGDHLMKGVNARGADMVLKNKNRVASVPFFALLPGLAIPSKTKRQCTADYKLNVIHKAVREILGLKFMQRPPRSTCLEQGIGFSYDEQGRIGRCLAGWRRKWIVPRFPLYEKGWTRQKCVEYLRTVVPHEVPRSSCVFCPFHRNVEWRWLRDTDPQGWARAVEVDKAIRVKGNVVNQSMDAEMFAHRSCVPLDQAVIDDPENTQIGFEFEGCTGGCAG
jgi:hypothetical protein